MVKVLALISGGIDSPVAAYMAGSHKGVEVIAVFFDGTPFIGPGEGLKVEAICRKLKTLVKLRSLYMLPHGENLDKIASSCNRKLTCLLCKRLMLRASSRLALREGAKALVTGDSLGQVASQTLPNLKVEDQASLLPVLRPLLGLNKEEIVKLAREIGTYPISTSTSSTCKAAPSKPSTQARLEAVKAEEAKLPIEEMVSKTLSGRKIKI
jgi:thiamine biosynthesis protein ThiI